MFSHRCFMCSGLTYGFVMLVGTAIAVVVVVVMELKRSTAHDLHAL